MPGARCRLTHRQAHGAPSLGSVREDSAKAAWPAPLIFRGFPGRDAKEAGEGKWRDNCKRNISTQVTAPHEGWSPPPECAGPGEDAGPFRTNLTRRPGVIPPRRRVSFYRVEDCTAL